MPVKQNPVLQFPQTPANFAEIPIALAPRPSPPRHDPRLDPAIDLSGKPKVVFLIGRGGSGKTTLARWLVEQSQAAGRQALLAALDPVNRTLANYFEGVAQPPSSSPAECVRWMHDLLGFVLDGKHSAVIDLGGGDTTMAAILETVPDLADTITAAGLAPVALYTLAPRIDDLAPFLSLRFQPPATAFILNEGLVSLGTGSFPAFAPLLIQPAIQDAIEAGARTVWMPRLDSDAIGQIERARCSFISAENGEKGIGPFKRSQVRNWRYGMDAAFLEMASWLP